MIPAYILPLLIVADHDSQRTVQLSVLGQWADVVACNGNQWRVEVVGNDQRIEAKGNLSRIEVSA